MQEITSRGLDALYRAEEDMLSNKLGFPALLQALQARTCTGWQEGLCML